MLEYYRFKKIYELFLKGREEEARAELAELQRRYVSLCDEITTYKTQVQEYEDILYLARNLVFDGEFYWLITGSLKQGPFCPSCYGRDGLLVRLVGEPEERHCPSCREEFLRPRAEALAAAVPSMPPRKEAASRQETPRTKVIPFRR